MSRSLTTKSLPDFWIIHLIEWSHTAIFDRPLLPKRLVPILFTEGGLHLISAGPSIFMPWWETWCSLARVFSLKHKRGPLLFSMNSSWRSFFWKDQSSDFWIRFLRFLIISPLLYNSLWNWYFCSCTYTMLDTVLSWESTVLCLIRGGSKRVNLLVTEINQPRY